MPPAGSIPLNPVEYVFTGQGAQPISFAFHYSGRLSESVLRSGLGRTLELFPRLDTRFCVSSGNDVHFLTDKGTVELAVRESSGPFDRDEGPGAYITPADGREGSPLAAFSMTHVRNGTVVAASMSHALADGFSAFHVLSSWARVCRGVPVVPPSPDRQDGFWKSAETTLAPDPEGLLRETGLFLGSPRTSAGAVVLGAERIRFSGAELRGRCAEIRARTRIAVTESDLVTARLWKRYLPQWAARDGAPDTFVTCPFDFRRVVAGFPRMYFGCALAFATASLDWQTLEASDDEGIAVAVHAAVSRIRHEAVLRSLRMLERFRMQNGLTAMDRIHLRHPRHGLIVTNLSRLPIRDVDFGSGPPDDFCAHADVPGGAALFPEEDGLMALVIPPLPA